MAATYSVDLIAKRDKKLRMDRSIVKGWNVHYQTQEEIEAEEEEKRLKEEQERQAQEIYQRLSEEAEMDEEKLREEIEAARKEAEAAFNAKTGSYSGRYGSKPVENEEEQQQINAILTEKPDAFDSAMSALQEQK